MIKSHKFSKILLKFKEICKAKLRKGFLWKSLKIGNLPF